MSNGLLLEEEMLKAESLVSIIIPVYNSEKYLAACIESAIAQTWENKEIIIVDDGSTDKSHAIAQKFASTPNLKALRQENKGAAAARNTGIREAKGDYIQFLDADDLLSEDKIAGQMKCLNGSQSYVALCRTVHFNEKEDHLAADIRENWYCDDYDDTIDFLIKLHAGVDVMPGYGGMITVHSWLTPSLLIEKAGPWNEKLSVDDDGEFFARVILASNGIRYSKEGLNYYRKYDTAGSLSGEKSLEAYKSQVLSVDLKYSYLKSRTNDPIVERVFGKHYWWAGVFTYPRFKSLSEYCINKAKQFGYSGEKYVGGPKGRLLAKLFGWKGARLFSWYFYNYGK